MITNTALQKLQTLLVKGELTINGATSEQWLFIFCQSIKKNSNLLNRDHLLIFSTSEQCELLYSNLKNFSNHFNIQIMPSINTNPYSSILPSESNLFKRFALLSQLANNPHQSPKPLLVLTSIQSLLTKNPPKSFFQENSFSIRVNDIISPFKLTEKLIEIGYINTFTVEEPGTFSQKGEIFDIYPIYGAPRRIHYFDDIIEDLLEIDSNTYKTLKDSSTQSLNLTPSPFILSQKKFSNCLRHALPASSPFFKHRSRKKHKIFSDLGHQILFKEYPYFVPLFFKKNDSLINFLNPNNSTISILDFPDCKRFAQDTLNEYKNNYNQLKNDPESENLLPSPSFLYFDNILPLIKDIPYILTNQKNNPDLTFNFESINNLFPNNNKKSAPNASFLKDCAQVLKNNLNNDSLFYFCYSLKSNLEAFYHFIDSFDFDDSIRQRLYVVPFNLLNGFFDRKQNQFIISENDLFFRKKLTKKTSAKKNIDLFAEQLSTLKKDDYVIHAQYGVGKYLGLKSLFADNQKTDYLILLYSNNDKVYVPIHKMNLIQKYAESSATVKVHSLRTLAFSNAKKTAKAASKKLAINLLQLQAERLVGNAHGFPPPGEIYHKFEKSFPFEETIDQSTAIHSVLEDMQKDFPMDHLICGDVGFGKTEIAMRAAFFSVLDSRQVAILVPTTLLALQHYQNFVKRFEDFPVNIEHLSRLKSKKEHAEIIKNLASGTIDLIIGTHQLLSNNIQFKNLGLVIVDEEHRFGVAHKEKLRCLKKSVDFLTLTATPIPRTLQMALLKLRQLSLIRTPPPKRQSIKTYLIKEDDYTLKNSIEKELQRNGQVFIVHNEVRDIERYAHSIHQLVPKASIAIAHGQLSEKILEERIGAFYRGEYQVLISTTIIESGLDIANANTIIVNNAHTLGLTQLHQLRGRIGRADRKAYAYFIIPKYHELSSVAERRLSALQTYSEIGSGFHIANCDLEIRGSGSLLGGEQSGHIETIGLELYMQLLEDAINELKGETKINNLDIEIKTPFTNFIPDSYICDTSQRLKQYKRLANCNDHKLLQSLHDEFIDIFGDIPEVLQNLFFIFEARIHLGSVGIQSIKLGKNSLFLKFNQIIIDKNVQLKDRILDIFLKRPKLYQFTPDYTVLYKKISLKSPLEFCQFCKELNQSILMA